MTAAVDLTNCRFGRLVALEVDATGKRRAWRCRCDCGAEAIVRASALTTGNSTSCGCGRVEAMRDTERANATHNLSRTPEYQSWHAMIARCYNEKNNRFDLYGGRGISVCDRWRFGTPGISGFEWFPVDMGERPDGKPTLDRIDVNGNYEPANCRWASHAEQNANRRPFVRGKRGPAKSKEAA